jgi:cell division protein FtsI/penicillin-binding protein 2
VLDYNLYISRARNQQNRTITIPAKRGDIYFRDGAPLAISEMSYFVFAEPINMKKEEKEKLVLVLERSYGLLPSTKDLLNQELWYVPLLENISEEQKNELEKEVGSGLYFRTMYKRFYPEKNLAKGVAGILASDNNGDDRGYWGVEGFYNLELKGRSGARLAEVDANGVPIIFGSYVEIPPISGKSLVLSIDRYVQHTVENILTLYLSKYNALSASAVVLDSASGAVLATAHLENINSSQEKEKLVSNGIIQETYEPGSVFKAFTMSAGIDLGLVTPETTFVDDGPKYYSEYKVDNWDGKHFGVESMYGTLEHSNNMGAAFVAKKLGSQKLFNYFNKFGIGIHTGIDLEGEQTGYLRDWETWSDIDLVTASFGQGVSATSLQVANGFVAIANGGELLKPFVTSFIDKEINLLSGDLSTTENRKKTLFRVMSLSTSNTLVEMLTRAASFGEAKYFISKKYKVAGKTGTAQIPIAGGYDPSKTNATFVGFLPTSRKFVMLIRFKEPKSSIYAAETAVPVWMEVAEKLADYYRIPPDY